MAAAGKVEALFKGRQFDQEIIVLCVRWYLRYKLSTRDLEEMMAERGVVLVHTTILRRVQHYVPEFENCWNQYARPVADRGGVTNLRKGKGPSRPICTAGR
jgi:transposase-like protein